MNELITSSPEPQNRQHTAQSGSQDSQPAQVYQSPQSIQPQPQGFQAPPRPLGKPRMNKEQVTPAVWVYEVAIGTVQVSISLVLILAGNQLVYLSGGDYGLLDGGGVIGFVIFTLIGLVLVVTDSSRPLKPLC